MQHAKPTARESEPKTTGRRRPRVPPRPPAADERRRSRLAPGVLLFDRYRLERELGSGGVADVWRARDERLDRSVAVKVLHRDLLPDEGWRRRFVAEARSASGLAHPGIVPVYDVLDDPETPAIVFQLVDGESLATRLARAGSIPPDDAVRIAVQVAEALDHAHRAGLVHRDVKPANIVIDDDGRARLVDFGIARLVDDASAEREGREVVGTLRYMAPEQLGGEPADARTDLYALGLVIAEMVPDLGAAPDWLRELVVRLREPNPADRPASAADVARALETGRLGLGASALPSPPGDAIATPPEVDPEAMTRSFAIPDRNDGPLADIPAGHASDDAAVLPVFATAGHVAAADAGSTPAAVAPAPAPVASRARVARSRRTDNRPIVIAALVTGLVLAGFAIGRGDLFGAAGGDAATSGPGSVILSAPPTPTEAPALPAAPRPKKPHGHGRG
jgi:hypothetical protein